MRLISEWTDDHLPCVSFEHEGNMFSVWWTDKALAGRIELIESGDISLEKALKKYTGLMKVIQTPFDAQFDSNEEGEPEDKECWEEGKSQYQTDAGFVEVEPHND